MVYLTVEVNERAFEDWNYNKANGDLTGSASSSDEKVVNKARVTVENGSDQLTEIPQNPVTPPPDIPKTGDESHLGFWMTLLKLSVAGLAISVICMARKTDPDNAKDNKRRK